MSYNTRPRPNVSQYIANLNIIPGQNELPQPPETFSTDDELALFVNSDFFDFDANGVQNVEGSIEFDPALDVRSRHQHATAFKQDMFNGTLLRFALFPFILRFSTSSPTGLIFAHQILCCACCARQESRDAGPVRATRTEGSRISINSLVVSPTTNEKYPRTHATVIGPFDTIRRIVLGTQSFAYSRWHESMHGPRSRNGT